MATYLPGVSDTGFNPVNYTPNLSFLTNAIDRATARYETNFQKISQGYQNILNSQIMNDVKSKQRDQYLNDIKDKLKTISATDLSVQANVNEAENLYSPFWEDKDMLAHITDTKERLSQLREQQRIAKEHPEYDNSTAQDVLNYYNNKIKTSADPNIINSIPSIKATAMPNRVVDFNKWLKDMNYEVTSPTTINGRTYTQTNGDGTQRTYSELFNEYLGNSAQDQYQMYGHYYKIQSIQDIKANEKLNTGLEISDEEAEKKIPLYYEKQAIESLEHNIKDYTLEQATITKNYELAKANNDNTKAELLAKRYKDLTDLLSNTNDGLKSLKEKKTINGVDYKTTMDNLFKNPVGFFAQTKLQRDALSAGVMAANKQSLKIETDNAYWNNAKMQQDADQFAQEMQYKYDALGVASKKKGSLSKGGTDPETGEQLTYSSTVPLIEAAPYNNELQTAIVRKKEEIASLQKSGTDLMVKTLTTSPSPYLATIASSSEISILSQGLGKDPKTFVGPERETYNKTFNAVKERLSKNNIDVSNITGPVNLFSGITKFYEGKIMTDLQAKEENKKNGEVNPTLDANIANELSTTFLNLKQARSNLDKAYAENITFNKAVNSKLSSDKYKDIRVKGKDGGYELITAQSLVDAFPLIDPKTKKKIGEIPLEIMQAYTNGTLKYNTITKKLPKEDPTGPAIEYKIHIVKDSKGKEYDLTNVVNALGTPEKLKEKLDKSFKFLSQEVDQNELKRFQEETGNMGKAITFLSPNDKGEDYADIIAFDVFSNPTKLVQKDDKIKIVGLKDNDTLAELIGKKVIPAITEDPYRGLSATSLYLIGAEDPSKRNVKFKYNLNDLKLGESDITALRDAGYSGEFTVELNNEATVRGFPQQTGSSYYNVLLSDNINKPVNQSDVEERAGLKYSFYKDADNVIWCKAGYEIAVPEQVKGTSEYITSYKWMDANPSRKGQTYPENNGYTELPAGQTVDDYIDALRSGLPDQFKQNSTILQRYGKVVNSQVPYATQERFKQLDKIFYSK